MPLYIKPGPRQGDRQVYTARLAVGWALLGCWGAVPGGVVHAAKLSSLNAVSPLAETAVDMDDSNLADLVEGVAGFNLGDGVSAEQLHAQRTQSPGGGA